MERLQTRHGVGIAWSLEGGHRGYEFGRPLARREVSRALLRTLLTERIAGCGGRFEFVQQCPECGSSGHGPLRVRLPVNAEDQRGNAPLVSVSYAGDLTVVGLAPPGSSAFGIDVEFDDARSRRAAAEALDRHEATATATATATPASAEPYRLREWTRLEAAAKASGRALHGDWRHASFDGLTLFEAELPTPQPVMLSVALSVAPDGQAPGASERP